MSFASKRRSSCVSSDTATMATAAGVADAASSTSAVVESRMYRHNRALMGMNWLTYVDDSNNDDIIDPSKTRFTVVVDGDASSNTLNSTTKSKSTTHVKSSYVVEQVLEEYRAQKLRNALLQKTEEVGRDHHDKVVGPASIFKRLLVGNAPPTARSASATETTAASTNSGSSGHPAAVSATSFSSSPSFPQTTSLESLWGPNDQPCDSSASVERNTFSSTYMSPQGLLQRAFKGLSSLYVSSSSSSSDATGNAPIDDNANTAQVAVTMAPRSGGFVASSSLFTNSLGLSRSSTTAGRRKSRRVHEGEGISRKSTRLSGVGHVLSADTTLVPTTRLPLNQEDAPSSTTIPPRSTSPRIGVIGLDLTSLAQELHTGILPQFVSADHHEHEIAPTPQTRDEEDHNHEGIGEDQDEDEDDLAATVALLANTSSFFGSASGSLNLRNSLLHDDNANGDGACLNTSINENNNNNTDNNNTVIFDSCIAAVSSDAAADSTDSPLELGETQRGRADNESHGNTISNTNLGLGETLHPQQQHQQQKYSSSSFEAQPQRLFKHIRNKYEKERFEVGSFVSNKFYGLYEKAMRVEAVALAEEAAKLKVKAKRMSGGARKCSTRNTKNSNDDSNISTVSCGITQGLFDTSSAAVATEEPFSFKTKKTIDFLSRNTTIDEMITFLDFQIRFLGSVNNREFVLRQYHSLMVSKRDEGDEEGQRDADEERAGRRQSVTLSPSSAHRNSSVSPPAGSRITSTATGGASSRNAGRYVPATAILIAEEERARPTLFPEPIHGYLPFENMSKGELLDHCLVLLHHLCGHRNRNNSSSPNASATVAVAVSAESLLPSGTSSGSKAKTAAKRQREEVEVDNSVHTDDFTPENDLEGGFGGEGSLSFESSSSIVDESWTLKELMIIAEKRGLLLAATSSSSAASSSSASRSSAHKKRITPSKKEILEMIRADERSRQRSLSPAKRSGASRQTR